MSRKIVVEPSKLEAAAAKMEAQAADYERQYKQMYTEVEGMGAAWKGADNQAYVTQIKGFTEDFDNMVKLMKDYVEFLRHSAKTYRDTQTETVNAAKRLTN
ncbi:WXG100 family type VII secretion target [Paenibacillus tarimensis]|uniref:WXG100 family type VII secretion target n=1 Tax=Paenibacillus tarimensis TaxID=416012 RepID=UPI001F46C89D|nr:WXG100 family type VII secretion target [Paenibacillus tarimensis]MCF2942873.1 WXG100 family type VII secretion target [Paenibacillus tarimensis]